MKKTLFVFVMMVLLIVLAACGGTETPPADNGGNEESTQKPADYNYSEELVQEYNASLEQLAGAMSKLDLSQSLSLESLVEELSQLDMKIEFEGEESSFVQIKDGVLYVTGEVDETTLAGDPAKVSTTQILKLYSNGIAMIQSQYGEYEVSVTPISIDTGSLVLKLDAESLRLNKEDIVADPQNQIYTLSDAYAQKLSAALGEMLSMGESSDESAENLIGNVKIDLGKLQSENTAVITMTLGEDQDVFTITVVQTPAEGGAHTTQITMKCESILEAQATLKGVGNTASEMTLTMDLPAQNTHLTLEAKQNNAAMEMTVRNEENPEEAMTLSVSSSVLADGTNQTALNMKLPASLLAGLDSSLGSALPEFELLDVNAEFTQKAAANGQSDYTANLALSLDEQALLSADIAYFAGKKTVVGEKFLTMDITQMNGTTSAAAQNLSVSLETVAWSEAAFEYKMVVTQGDASGSVQSGIAKITGPVAETLPLTEQEKTYLERCDKLFANYELVEAKMTTLYQNAIAYVQTSFTVDSPRAYFIKDYKTGLVYLTDFVVENGMVSIYINCVIDYEEKTYFRIEANEWFQKRADSQSTTNINELMRVLTSSDTIYQSPVRRLMAVAYVEKIDQYLAVFYSSREPEYYSYKPTEDMFPEYYLHWYTLGTDELHQLKNQKLKDCTVIAVCEGCGIAYRRGQSHTEYKIVYQNTDYTAPSVTLQYCSGCGDATIVIQDIKTKHFVKLTLSALNETHLQKIAGSGVTFDLPMDDEYLYLVIDSVDINCQSDSTFNFNGDIVIPDISLRTKCKIIGSMASWPYMMFEGESNVVYPDGVMFRYDYIGEIDNNRFVLPDSLLYNYVYIDNKWVIPENE